MFTRKFFNNKYLQGAFLAGFVLLVGVLLIPGCHSVFKVAALSLGQLGCIFGLAFLNLPVIQLLKKISSKIKK